VISLIDKSNPTENTNYQSPPIDANNTTVNLGRSKVCCD